MASLKDLGLRIQLGHPIGVHCINPKPAVGDNFTIIDSNGVHSVALDFCACETAASLTAQLLRKGLFPATVKSPRSAVTFRALRHFQILSFQSKVSAHEFYYALVRQTNNIFTPPQVSNCEICCILSTEHQLRRFVVPVHPALGCAAEPAPSRRVSGGSGGDVRAVRGER